MRKIKLIILFAVVSALGFFIIFFSKEASLGAKSGIFFCAQVIIPSLFPFMVLATFTVKSGISSVIGKFLNPVTKFLFNLPGSTASTIAISLIGGYPTGARGINTLLKDNLISHRDARHMLCFCIGAGPAFVINVVAMHLFNNYRVGVILLLSQIISAILLGILSSFFYRSKNQECVNANKKSKSQVVNLSTALIESTLESIEAMINMSGFIVLFSTFLAILESSSLDSMFEDLILRLGITESYSRSLLPLLLEIVNGCNSAFSNNAPLELISFALAFAGICIHFQIFSSVHSLKFSKTKFIIFRLVHGLLAYFLTHFLVSVFPCTAETYLSFSDNNLEPFFCFGNAPLSLALLLMCTVFLLSLTETKRSKTQNKFY